MVLAELAFSIYFILQLFTEEKLGIASLIGNLAITILLPTLFIITIKYNKWGIYIC